MNFFYPGLRSVTFNHFAFWGTKSFGLGLFVSLKLDIKPIIMGQ